ncbi:conserved exported hypothetical protein [Thiomonas arsenitoxydans]|uniref:Lipoprotein n=1 Tax=Thiomonas arsenitoxydans (strain DSM 22701 / CIP 110005 / 3As) TaxID=426114 RepID=D6CVW0_THIA3|nr:hypothetical protein [Thiomonas arsenitoxydans]CAZ90449.1 hypothetical protein THI_p0053 [Thiomonas arsenitoxydans]CQR32603.1 conserved exported hypothetical protein [Thiomonas arsenitoxydans]CQR45730.1 conserved exported protein of unknown function [Thiomonas sp. CB3]
MKYIYVISTVLSALILGACSKPDVDANGVPKIASASAPVVDGKAMTPEAFKAKYCSKPETFTDPICGAVQSVLVQKSITNVGKPLKW